MIKKNQLKCVICGKKVNSDVIKIISKKDEVKCLKYGLGITRKINY